MKKFHQASIIGVTIFVILMLAVALPTTTNMLAGVTSQGINATQGVSSPFTTIVRLLPMLIGVAVVAGVGYSLYKEAK